MSGVPEPAGLAPPPGLLRPFGSPGRRTPVTAVGGSVDPQSAVVADVEAVQRAAVAYRVHAEAMAQHAATLRSLDLQMIDATAGVGGVGGPRDVAGVGDLVRRPVAAWRLRHLAHRLDTHAEARVQLAGRAQIAVTLYHDVDAANAAAFDALLARGRLDPRIPPPFVLERSGTCSSPGPGAESARLPVCPGYEWVAAVRPEDVLRPQRLSVVAVRPVPTPRGQRPGLAGAMQAVRDGYSAPGSAGAGEADTIDVRRHVHREQGADGDGPARETYVVTLPGTSGWDLLTVRGNPEGPRTLRPNIEGALGRASAEARLLPEVLERAGVPPGAPVLLVGHSQGGMTAMSAAALPAMRRYRLCVLTAGSPVGRMPVAPEVTYLHVTNPGDAVPRLEGAANRRSRNQATVSTGKPVTSPGDDHDVGRYVEESERLDRLEGDRGGPSGAPGVDVPPALSEKLSEFRAAGHLRGDEPGDVVETTRVWVRTR